MRRVIALKDGTRVNVDMVPGQNLDDYIQEHACAEPGWFVANGCAYKAEGATLAPDVVWLTSAGYTVTQGYTIHNVHTGGKVATDLTTDELTEWIEEEKERVIFGDRENVYATYLYNLCLAIKPDIDSMIRHGATADDICQRYFPVDPDGSRRLQAEATLKAYMLEV